MGNQSGGGRSVPEQMRGPDPHPNLNPSAATDPSVHVPAEGDPAVQSASLAILQTGQLLPGGCYLIVYDKLRFSPATMARVVDYLGTQDIRTLLLACRGDVSGALQVVPAEELDR